MAVPTPPKAYHRGGAGIVACAPALPAAHHRPKPVRREWADIPALVGPHSGKRATASLDNDVYLCAILVAVVLEGVEIFVPDRLTAQFLEYEGFEELPHARPIGSSCSG